MRYFILFLYFYCTLFQQLFLCLRLFLNRCSRTRTAASGYLNASSSLRPSKFSQGSSLSLCLTVATTAYIPGQYFVRATWPILLFFNCLNSLTTTFHQRSVTYAFVLRQKYHLFNIFYFLICLLPFHQRVYRFLPILMKYCATIISCSSLVLYYNYSSSGT